MAKNRPGPANDWSRSGPEEAAARRLAILAADLGHAPDPAATSEEHVSVAPTRWPGRSSPESPPEPAPEPAPESADGSVLPRPGRHADRRRRGAALRSRGMPGIGPAHLAVLALLVAMALAGTTWWLLRERPTPVPAPAAVGAESMTSLASPAEEEGDAETDGDDTAASGTTAGSVTVDVAGKVRRPGIVVLDEGARVVDALEAAGGPRRGVRTHGLNLARVLTDGEQILVGRSGPARPALASPGEGPLVDLNRADPAELEELPGVGPVTAAAIVEWREQHGGFRSVDQLIDVSGIGEKTLAEIAPHATV